MVGKDIGVNRQVTIHYKRNDYLLNCNKKTRLLDLKQGLGIRITPGSIIARPRVPTCFKLDLVAYSD